MNFRTQNLERMLPSLMNQIEGAMARLGLLSLPTRQDIGERFVHSMTNMNTLKVFITDRSSDRDGWNKAILEIKKAGIYVTTVSLRDAWDAGAACENGNYKVAVCTPEEKEILLKNRWSDGNIIISVPNMDKGAVLKALVRAWLATWIK